MTTGEQIHLVGWAITFIALSIFYVRKRKGNEMPAEDIFGCLIMFLISGIWFIFVPIMAGMLFLHIWIKILVRIFGK